MDDETFRNTVFRHKALSIVGMSLTPMEQYTRYQNRQRSKRLLLGSVSFRAFRNAGALDGRINLNHLNMMAKHAAINLGPQ